MRRGPVAEKDFYRAAGQKALDAAGPLDERYALRIAERFAQTRFSRGAHAFQAIAVDVVYIFPPAPVPLHQNESRARRAADAESRQKPLSESRLARAEISRKRDHAAPFFKRRRRLAAQAARLG